MKSIIRTVSCAAALLIPSFAFAYGYGPSIGSTAQIFIDLIDNVFVPLLFAIAFIVFLWGVAKAYIIAPSTGDSEGVKGGHTLILWGIIGFAVMISLWGLVNVVVNTFQLSGTGAPQLPTSY